MKQILRAETAAVIAEIYVAPGDAVPAGELLITTELMKMRHEMRAMRRAL
jgi:biotin carboxyl carrier protein